MKYLIIGLGIYGTNLACDLVNLGHDVIGADIDSAAVNEMKNHISTVYQIDSTEEHELSVLPLRNVDLVIVAIGENFGASIKTVALLKKMGVRHIYARAIDTLHKAILESFGIDRIVTPEQRAAYDLSCELELGSSVMTLSVGTQNVVINFSLPSYLEGMAYAGVEKYLSDRFGVRIVAACRPTDKSNILGIRRKELKLVEDMSSDAAVGDVLTVFGDRKSIRELCRSQHSGGQ